MADADVFISYSRSDRPRVERLAAALQAAGLSVWYDAGLQAGEAYDARIMQALRGAKAVLVAWSAAGVESQWVRAEATEGRAQGKLVACLLEPCRPYPPFNLIHAEDLSDFDGAAGHEGFARLLGAVRAKLDPSAAPPAEPRFPPPAAPRRRTYGIVWVAAGISLIALAAGVGAFLAGRGPAPDRPATDVAQGASTAAPSSSAPTGAAVPPPAASSPAQPPAADPAQPPPARRQRPDLSGARTLEVAIGYGQGATEPDPNTLRQIDYQLRQAGGGARVRWVEIERPSAEDGPPSGDEIRRRAALTTLLAARGVPDAALPLGQAASAASPLDPGRLRLRLFVEAPPPRPAAEAPPEARPDTPQFTVAERDVAISLPTPQPGAELSPADLRRLDQALQQVGRGEVLQIVATGYYDPTGGPQAAGANRRRVAQARDHLIGLGVPAGLIITDERRDAANPRVQVYLRYRPAR